MTGIKFDAVVDGEFDVGYFFTARAKEPGFGVLRGIFFKQHTKLASMMAPPEGEGAAGAPVRYPPVGTRLCPRRPMLAAGHLGHTWTWCGACDHFTPGSHRYRAGTIVRWLRERLSNGSSAWGLDAVNGDPGT